ncbi:MAG: sensor histidine kinase [Actinomycetota bacterium]
MAMARGPRPREIDEDAALLVARLRLIVVSVATVSAAISFGDAGHPRLQYTLAFVVVPVAAALALSADRLASTTAATVGAALDLTAFGVALIEFPDAAGALGAVFLVPVLLASYTGGRLLGASLGFAGVTTIGVADAADAVEPSSGTVMLLALAIAVSLAVVGRADARLLRSASRARYHEARASLIVEHLSEAIVVTDSSSRVTQLNAAAEALLSVPPGAARCESVLDLAIAGRRLDCSNGCALLDPEGGEEPGGVEAIARSRADGGVPVMVSVAKIPGADGDSGEYLHTLRDITKLKRAEEAKTLFLATATHELKTPVTVIAGFLQTIADPRVDAEFKATAIEVMRRRADELSRIIERLLLASRIESGRLAIDVSATDVAAIAQERAAALASAMGRTIDLEVADGVPLARSQGNALATVLDHLLDNAGKYSSADADICIEIGADDADVIVAVRDSGHGMTEDEAAHCFDRFWQADLSSRRKAGGTGIGLYIVRSLVDSMGGSICVASAPGEGTEFTIRFSRADVPQAPVAAHGLEPVAPEPSIVREFMRQIGVETKETKETTA